MFPKVFCRGGLFSRSFGFGNYNGMLPCFLCGLVLSLLWVISRAWISLKRVWRGRMISSIYPFSAA